MTLRPVPLRLLGLLFTGILSLGILSSAARAATSVSQHGITWTFDKDYPTGQFANGDYWVVGPVTITNITPRSSSSGGVTMHGSIINPIPNAAHGFDSRIRSNSFDATKNVARSFPITVRASSSILSSKSYSTLATGNNPQLETIAILTVVASAPPAGSFRPPYAGTDKTIRWNKADLDYSKLRSLPKVTGTPALADVEALFAKPFIDIKSSWAGTYLQPATNHPAYGREISHEVAAGLLSLQLNYTNAQKQKLLIRMVQRGIDIHGLAMNGAHWKNDGGHRHGRKPLVLLAGAVLNSPTLLGWADAKQHFIFQEDQQTFYVTLEDVLRPRKTSDGRYRAPYLTSMIGTPEWGGRHIGEPEGDAAQWDCHYRDVCGASTVGTVLAARLMGLESKWNWPVLFDYMDRYFKAEGGSPGTSPNKIQPFVAAMWKAYRNSSTNFTVDNTSTDQIWQEVPIAAQTGTFTCAFDVVASTSSIDGIAGLAQGVPSQLSHLVASVRFTSSGTIVANNGSTYQASTTVRYSAGVKYRVVITADVVKKTYSVNVTPQGGSAVTVAQNWAFRSTAVTKLDHIGFVSNSGAVSVTNVGVQSSGTSAPASTSTTTTSTTGDALVRVNAGGGAYTDSSGKRWAGDTGFLSGLVSTTTNAISDTTNDRVYQSERYDPAGGDNLKYGFNIPNGNYVVKLHFAETWSGAYKTGGRVFSVKAEGQTVVSKLDIYGRAGANRALVVAVPVKVSDGRLGMEFVPHVQNPTISGIEIYQAAQ